MALWTLLRSCGYSFAPCLPPAAAVVGGFLFVCLSEQAEGEDLLWLPSEVIPRKEKYISWSLKIELGLVRSKLRQQRP